MGRTYSGLSDEATAAIIHLRGEADRLTDEERPAELEEDQAPEAPAPPARTRAPAATDSSPSFFM